MTKPTRNFVRFVSQEYTHSDAVWRYYDDVVLLADGTQELQKVRCRKPVVDSFGNYVSTGDRYVWSGEEWLSEMLLD